jgi:hypothetical protein
VLMSMLAWVKRDPHELPNHILALTQNCLEQEATPRWIPIDGDPTPEQIARVLESLPPRYRELSVATLVGLAALVDPSKSAGDIPLPLRWVAPTPPSPIRYGWPAYGFRTFASPSNIQICPATCRPRYTVGDATWVEAAVQHYGAPPKDMLSTSECYGRYVVKNGAYPTRDDMLTFLYNRYVRQPGGHKTLPYQTEQFIAEVLAEYAEIARTLTPAEFARRWKASCSIRVRKEMEA